MEAQIADARLKSLVSRAKQQQIQTELEQSQVSPRSSVIKGAKGNAELDVQVVYIGQRQGRWTAMLSEGGAYFEVRTGTRLADGWEVASIDSVGVILQRGGEKRLLRMPRTV